MRPSSIQVHFDREYELRFNFADQPQGPSPVYDVVMPGQSTGGDGTWTTTEEIRAAWQKPSPVPSAPFLKALDEAGASLDRLQETNRRRVTVASLLVTAIILAVLALLAGCSTTDERREHLIRAGRILIRHSTPEPDWATRRETWLAASEIECPEPAEGGK